MKPVVAQILRSRGLTVSIHAGLWVLLYLTATGLGGKTPYYRGATASSAPAQSPVPVARLSQLFSPQGWPKSSAVSNANPFLTRYFIPAPPPPPPPPTTRKIELTYQGFYQIPDHAKVTMVKLGDAFLVTALGSNITANLFAADATGLLMTLTNAMGQTNLLPLNTKKELEVPIQ